MYRRCSSAMRSMDVDATVLTHIIVEQATAARTVANAPCSRFAKRWNDAGAIMHGNEIVVELNSCVLELFQSTAECHETSMSTFGRNFIRR